MPLPLHPAELRHELDAALQLLVGGGGSLQGGRRAKGGRGESGGSASGGWHATGAGSEGAQRFGERRRPDPQNQVLRIVAVAAVRISVYLCCKHHWAAAWLSLGSGGAGWAAAHVCAQMRTDMTTSPAVSPLPFAFIAFASHVWRGRCSVSGTCE